MISRLRLRLATQWAKLGILRLQHRGTRQGHARSLRMLQLPSGTVWHPVRYREGLVSGLILANWHRSRSGHFCMHLHFSRLWFFRRSNGRGFDSSHGRISEGRGY